MAKKNRAYRKEAVNVEPEKVQPISEVEEDEKEQPQESVDQEKKARFRIYNPIKAGHTVTVTTADGPQGIKFDKDCVSEPVNEEIYRLLTSLPRYKLHKE